MIVNKMYYFLFFMKKTILYRISLYRVYIMLNLGNAEPEMGIEGRGHEEDLREDGGGLDGAGAGESEADAVCGEAVQRLHPPLVAGDVEAGDGGVGADQLLYLLVDG